MKHLLFFIVMVLVAVQSFGQEDTQNDQSSGIVKLNSTQSYLMLEQNQNLRKLDILLDAKEDGQIEKKNIYLGASLVGIMDYQHSNTENKFGYLMRHPTANNQRTQTVSEIALHSVQLSFTGAVNSWVTVYGEFLYDPEQSFGAGTTTALTRNQVQLRKGYVLLADPTKSPLYLAFGKMDGNFGQTGGVNPFSSTTMWHAFGTLAYGGTIGFRKSGFNASVMLIQGGAQFRAANTPVDGTNIPSLLNNFGADANYSFDLGGTSTLNVGASYQKGSGYCQDYPVQHFMPCQESNPAYTFYGTLGLDKFTLKGAFATTSDPWPGTHNPNPPLNEFEASKVSSLILGGQYRIKGSGDIDYLLSGEFSNFVAGADGSPWERQNQIIVGFAGEINKSSRLFVELFNTSGYAPLNFISGGNQDDPGTTHSDSDASSIGIVLGGMITL